MSRRLDDLDQRMKLKAFELIARCAEAGVPVMIIDTLRTHEEQKANMAKGVSWTLNSKHLPQQPDGKSLAIDVAPYAQYAIHGTAKLQWDASDPVWARIGEIGEKLGLGWGGRWKQRDLGHLEFRE